MADKYLRHGAPYCGDGTTSAAAASNGAAGAWNNINVFTGTAPAYGALAAGDTVYMRSKDNAGADIAISMSGAITIGSASATVNSWVNWVLDGGTVWSGISGTLTYSSSADAHRVGFQSYNRISADVADGITIRETFVNAYAKPFINIGLAYIENVFFDWSAAVGSYGCSMVFGDYAQTTLVNPRIKMGLCYLYFLSGGQSSLVTLINPSIEMTVANFPLFGTKGTVINVYGGELYGAGASGVGIKLWNNGSGGNGVINLVGFEYPRTVGFANADLGASAVIRTSGGDGGLGAGFAEVWGEAKSRVDGYPPHLNAFLPDASNTPWAWWIYPSATSPMAPMNIPVAKVFTGAAATKTISGYVLVADTFTGVAKNTLWMDVVYVDDSTGRSKRVTTFAPAGGALTTSTAGWSGSTYGAINLLKREFSLTTPTAIKAGSVVKVSLRGTIKSANANDILFFCPDVSIS